MSFYIGTPPAGEMPTSALGQAPGLDLTSFESTMASAATVDIGSSSNRRVAITGTTAITSFGTQPNRERIIRFTGALTLTQNSTSLILPTGANIATVAGDMCFAVSDTSGNWRVIAYQRADGTALVAAASGSVIFNAAQGLNSSQQIQAKRNIGATGTGYSYVGGNLTIDGSYAGAYLLAGVGSNITMPPLSAITDGSVIKIHAWSGAATITANSADGAVLFYNGNSGLSSVPLRFGQCAEIYKSGNQWLFFGMNAGMDDAPSVSTAQAFTRAQMARARANIGAFPLYAGQVSSTTSLDASHLNKTVWLSGGGFNLTVPPASVATSGDFINIVNYGNGYITLIAPANNGFYYNGNYFVGSCPIGPGETAQLTTDGGSWIVGCRGISPENTIQANAVSAFNDTQKQNIYNATDMGAHAMNCRLTYQSSTQIRLVPFGGNKIFINGNYRTIPSSGVNAGNSGLGLNTRYYVYAYWTGSSIALSITTNGYETDTTYGYMRLVGNGGYVLVGMVYIDADGVFKYSNAALYVASYYNRVRNCIGANVSGGGGTNAGSFVQLGPFYYALNWNDSSVRVSTLCYAVGSAAGAQLQAKLKFIPHGGSVTDASGVSIATSYATGAYVNLPISVALSPGEGVIGYSVYVLGNGGGGTFSADLHVDAWI